MTNNEVKATLRRANRIISMMDKSHINRLFQILINAQGIKNCAFFLSMDVRKLTKKLLVDFIKSDFVNDRLTRKQMKDIFKILGDYDLYPKCKLCNKPIVINSDYARHEANIDQMAFSWDHVLPKSMGGGYNLENMQPTHKICNNKRGVKPAYDEKGNTTIIFNVTINCSCCQKYRPAKMGFYKYELQKRCCERSR